MIALTRLPVALAALLFMTSCTNGATSSTPTVVPAAIAKQSKLQLAVGTATIAYAGGSITGTNFVATFRAADGHSATLANTPTITGPPGLNLGFGNSISGVLPNVFDAAVLAATEHNAVFPTSFGGTLGPLVGVFGYGMAADNLLSSQVALQYGALKNASRVCFDLNTASENTESSAPIASQGTINGVQVGGSAPATSEAQSNELGLPVGFGQANDQPLATCPLSSQTDNPPLPVLVGQSSVYPINYYGGPPAWPSPQGYGQPTFFVGYPVGFTDFAAAPVAGSYSLDVAYPTNQSSTTYAHVDANATLKSTSGLPVLTISSATATQGGSGTVTLTVPSGLYEAIVFVRAQDCDATERPNAQPDNYALVTHSSGIQSFVFSANLGPPDDAGAPTPTFCGGSGATAYAVGFDYPAYESSYPFNVSQTPTITNSNGQADVTTSAPVSFTEVQ
jgi:hypothetical protein